MLRRTSVPKKKMVSAHQFQRQEELARHEEVGVGAVAAARHSVAVESRRESTKSRKSCRVSTHTKVVAAQTQKELVDVTGGVDPRPHRLEPRTAVGSWGHDGSAEAEWRRKHGMIEWPDPPLLRDAPAEPTISLSWAPSEIIRPRGRRLRGDPCSSSDDEQHALRTKKPKRRRMSAGSAAEDYFGTHTKKVRNTNVFARGFGRKPDHRRQEEGEEKEENALAQGLREMAVESKRKRRVKTVQRFNWLEALMDDKVRFPISRQAFEAMDRICSVSNFQKWRSYVMFHRKSIIFHGFGSKYGLLNCFKHQMLADVSCFELQGFHHQLSPKQWSFQEWFYGVMAQLWPKNKGKFCALFSKAECSKKSSRFEHGVPSIQLMVQKFIRAMHMSRENPHSKDGSGDFTRASFEYPLHKVEFSRLYKGDCVYLTVEGVMKRAIVLSQQKEGKLKLKWTENDQEEIISGSKWDKWKGRVYHEHLDHVKVFKFSRPVIFMIHNFENMRLRKYLHVFKEIARCQQVRFIISIDDQRAQELYCNDDYRIFEFVTVIANTHVPYEREFFYEMYDKKNQPPIWTGEHKSRLVVGQAFDVDVFISTDMRS